jgi:hypothetical protein
MTTLPDRTYSVEIECFLPDGTSHAAAATAITARGIDCRPEHYNHREPPNRTWWKLVPDGSLGDYARGAEFVAPVFHGEEGFAQITKVMEALQDLNAGVNYKTGLHVHIGCSADLTLNKTLAKLYGAYESVIDSIMPLSRRANNVHRDGGAGRWCRSIAHPSREQIDNCRSLSDLCGLLRPGSVDQRRYVKLNLTRRHPTAEFRQHSGTLDPVKSIVWIKTCMRMVDAAASGIVFNQPAPVVTTPKVRRNSKRAIVVNMLLRPEGATREQLLAATNWPTISVQDVVSRTGMELMTTRMGRRITYRLNQAAAQAHSLGAAASPMDISIAGLCSLIGSSDEERMKLEERARNLASAHQWAA